MDRKSIGTVIVILTYSLSALAAGGAGATVPFTTLEAEGAVRGGGATLNDDAVVKVASSGRGYAHLNATGEYVQFTVPVAANRLTLRYSIPQNTSGTISLYLNGAHNQDIQLTSTQCYDNVGASYVRRYDEIPVTITVPAGATIKIQKDAADACAWYGIDLVDVETAPAALSRPANFLSIADYGATGSDASDDAAAIRSCVAAAQSQNKGVWVPAGTFYQNSRVTIPANVDLKGAGIWYSRIHFPVAGSTWTNDIGYSLSSGTTVSDIRLTGAGTSRDNACILFNSVGANDTLQNLWIQNVGCVHGWEGSTPVHHNLIRNCRIVGTYFDGIHWGDGAAYNNLVEQVFFRGLGDDAIAQVNRQDQPLCHDNTARFNTVIASYWGRGLSDVGGDDLTMTDNFITDVYNAGVIVTTEVLSPSISRPIRGLLLARNTIRKCGHTGHNHAGIHTWLDQSAMSGVVIEDNLIDSGETGGIRFDDTDFGDADGRTILRNNIARCNAGANYGNASNDIVPVLTNNDFSGCAPVATTEPLVRHYSSAMFSVSADGSARQVRITLGVAMGASLVSIHALDGALVEKLPVSTARSGSMVMWDAATVRGGVYLVRYSAAGQDRSVLISLPR